MKCKYPDKGLSRICRLFGVTRQAFYQHTWEKEDQQTSDLLVLKEVRRIRQLHRQMGGRKLYLLLEPFLLEHGIKIGRDALFDLLAANNLLNGILKDEYLSHYQIQNVQEAKTALNKAIKLYNEQRPHMSINNHTPDQVHKQCKINVNRLWKNYYKKLNTFNQSYPVNLLQDLSINL